MIQCFNLARGFENCGKTFSLVVYESWISERVLQV